ncbi:SAM-dependent methyltransferase [Actinomycetospora chiangmaiensis]|uniref:SAM-dependent methyltransferase n=1 Tax=Actinomycetospora chiangmaiensis TaxID=402650 RepID=UPI0003673794|nr:SAM-dependent methyltransferase [Actinomycetospora chiangmaiensis]
MDADTERANVSRMYDYLLGGSRNFAVDRERAEDALLAHPAMRHIARANRAYLRRVVQWCLEQGIDQFLDLGSDVPTVGNVHEVALRSAPSARVAYVDIEPVAVAHAAEILDELGNPLITITQADIGRPQTVFDAPGVGGLFDFTRPIAVLAMAALHFVDDDVVGITAEYQARLAPGSVFALSHGTDDHENEALAAGVRAARDAYRNTSTPLFLRDRREIAALFGTFELVPPGLVDVVDWPTEQPGTEPALLYAGVGRLAGPRRTARGSLAGKLGPPSSWDSAELNEAIADDFDVN